MIKCSFLPVFYEHHRRAKTGEAPASEQDFANVENIWLGFYGLGKFETYRFLYEKCDSFEDLEDWMIRLKGERQVHDSAAAFDRWTKGDRDETAVQGERILSEAQWQDWRDRGYIRVSGLVDGQLCDAVSKLICSRLDVDLSRPETWYGNHPDWHGLMLQVYQDERINAIKTLPGIRRLFTELYGTANIIANTEKVSYNPPESPTWKFRHGKLHWDIDFAHMDLYYIQGLVYLNDVPEDRGPLKVVPGFHHRFEDWIKTYPDCNDAHQAMQRTLTGTPVPGQKGDVVLWLQTLPHAASTNHSDLPRFVQYVSFSKC